MLHVMPYAICHMSHALCRVYGTCPSTYAMYRSIAATARHATQGSEMSSTRALPCGSTDARACAFSSWFESRPWGLLAFAERHGIRCVRQINQQHAREVTKHTTRSWCVRMWRWRRKSRRRTRRRRRTTETRTGTRTATGSASATASTAAAVSAQDIRGDIL